MKFTREQRLEIIERYNNGESGASLGKEFTTISRVLNYKSWRP